MLPILACLLLGAIPHDDLTVVDRVAVVEINHVYDSTRRECPIIHSQFIFYDYEPSTGRMQIVDWRLVRDTHYHEQPDGSVVLMFHDTIHTGVFGKPVEILRVIHADSVRNVLTDYDRELCERSEHHKRRLLRNPLNELKLQGQEHAVRGPE